MVSKNNVQVKDRYATKQVPHYGIRKLSVGVASVLLSTTLYMGVTAHADTTVETNPQPSVDQPAGTTTGNVTGNVQLKSTSDQSASTTTNSISQKNDGSAKAVQTVSPEQSADTTDVQLASGQSESVAVNSNAPENDGNAASSPTALPKQPVNADTPSTATMSGVQPFVNLAVESDNNDLTPTHETIDSKWTLHYVNQADHKQELKDPTVITMQYTRTDTPQSDGTTKYGDWSYVPGSFKQTGTPITVKDSNNPVKQDNVDKNGENFDVFIITAMYPTVAGYGFYNGINGTRLRDNLRNNERQADTMSKDFYAEYDAAKQPDVAKPTRETVGSQWRIHYIDSTNREHELKAPTVINLQYTRTNTPQSDGTIQHGDWSYVPGSFKLTGTPITVKDSDNPVKQDNIDSDGKNEDIFTINAMYPTITGYNFHDGISYARLHDHLLNYDSNGSVQAPTIGSDFYVEYDPISERSVAVKFLDDQSYDPDTSDHEKQVGQAITLTGRDGDTVDLKLTVPDKYELADGQQLPTSYTFAKGSGDLKIHLVHKVVQREAKIDVQLGLITLVRTRGDDGDDAVQEVVTQTRWKQLEDSHGNLGHSNILLYALPFVEVGTLTGHVGYDLVDETVVSLKNDWTSLNLSGHSYELPNGTEVVNGIRIDGDDVMGKKLRDDWYLNEYRKWHHDVDPDYITRPWHGYLSVNETNNELNSDYGIMSDVRELGLQAGLVGDEPNALAKAIGDRAATSVEMANKTIDPNWLKDNGYDFDFSEQDGQLRAKAPLLVAGVYIPYVEKTATRTINVTTPDGKTTTVKQTATLAKQVDFGKDAHPAWTTGEWANYDVPTIPGYTASQSNVNKETVTGETKDQTVNITYTANPQTTTVVYQTEDGTPVHTTTVNGHTGQTVKVSNEVPVGWHVVNGTVPSEITFAPNGTQKTVVIIAHSHATVTPDAPKTTGDKLPDNPGKTYPAGVGETDLNKTVTRTIKVTTPDGQNKTIAQTVKLTRTADVDEVTGEVKYSDWTTGNWSAYTAPSVPGYTASQSNVAQQAVTDTTKDQTVNVTYTANDHQISIEYVDNATGQVVKTDHVSGKTGQTVAITPHVPDGWELVSGQSVPSEVTVGADGAQATVIKVQPQERSVAVKFVDDQSDERQVGQAITVTGRDGGTSNLNLTVPDKYRLADGQQLPTTYTFKKGSGDLTIHLVHQVVQREATVDVQLRVTTTVDIDGDGYPVLAVTQTRWKQVDDKIKDSKDFNSDKVFPSVEVGTLTGHVGYDLVDNQVVSFNDDWTSLNLGGQTYQMPDGTEVVNGMFIDSESSWGKTLKEQYLKYYTDADSDYVNRTWHGYLSANETNEIAPGFTSNELQAGLVGNEPNKLAKVIGDQAATAVKMANKTIDSNWLKGNFDTSEFSEQNGRLQASTDLDVMGVYIPYVEKIATRTINVITPDGKTTTVKQTATLAKQVDFGKDAHPAWTTGEWASYDVPTIPGYTVSQSQVAKETVTGTTNDQTVNINYTANPQTAHINYVDVQGKLIHTTTVNGQTDQTVEVPNEVPTGWKLVEGQTVPATITFGPDGHADTSVKIEHRHVTVTPDKPQTNGTKLPDNLAQSFHGVEASDLNKMVTRTIKVTQPNGTITNKVQTVKLTRIATVDEVTGDVSYSNWSTGEWAKYDVPAVNGYTATQTEVAAVSVNEHATDQTVNVTYTPDAQKLNVKFIDDTTGQVLKTVTKTGVTNADAGYNTQSDIQSYEGQHYVLVSDSSNGANLVFDNNDSTDQAYEVHLTHATTPITESTSTSQVIHYQLADGTPVAKDYTAKVDFSRDGFKDLVTNADHWNAWTPSATQTFDIVKSPAKAGYTPDHVQVDAVTVEPHHANLETTVTYSPDAQKAAVKYIDDVTGEVLQMKELAGVSDETSMYTTGSTIKQYVGQHYKLVSDQTNGKPVAFDHDDGRDQTFEVHLTHTYQQASQEHQVHQTIHYRYVDGKQARPDYTAEALAFSRTGTQDLVTENIQWNAWTPDQVFASVDTPSVNGYTPDVQTVAPVKVSHDSKDIEQTVIYHADDQTILVNYIDDDTHSTLKTDSIIGKTAQTSDYTTKKSLDQYKGQHYDVVSDDTNGDTLTFDSDSTKVQTYNVHLKHQHQAASDKSTVHQTVHYVYQDGKQAAKDHTATPIEFTRIGDTDLVTGKTIWNAWTPATGTFVAVLSPAISGYTPSQAMINHVTVHPGDKDIDTTVTYVPDRQVIVVNYIDQMIGKTLKTDTLNGHSDQVSGYTTKSQIDSYLGQHCKLISDDTNGQTLTFDHDDQATQTYDVVLGHQTEAAHRTHEVHETVDYVYADGSQAAKSFTAQPIVFSQTGVHDLVTNTTDWNGEWTKPQVFVAVESPKITGFTASRPEVKAVKVNHESGDVHELVIYAANAQTAQIKYIDDVTGKTLETDGANGHFNESIVFSHNVNDQINKFKQAHYKLVSNNFAGQKYQADDTKNVYEVHLTHERQNVHATDTVTETVKFQYADGSQAQPTKTQTVNFGRDGVKDLVTGTTAWMPVDPQTIGVVDVPAIDGYTADIDQVLAVKVNFGDKDITKVVTYTANDQNAGIKIIDDTTGKVLNTQVANGKFGTEIQFKQNPDQQVIDLQAQHYGLVSDNFKHQTYQADNAKNQFEIHVKHQMMDAQRTDKVTETVRYQDNHGNMLHPVTTQTKTFTEHGITDQVTGKTVWTPAKSQTMDAVGVPEITGYTPDKQSVPATTVNFGDKDISEVIIYTPVSETANIKYIDDTTGKTLLSDQVTGDFGSQIKFDHDPLTQINQYEGQGYKLVSNSYGKMVHQFSSTSGENNFEVHFKHGTVPVIDTDTVTETIHYLGPDGNKLAPDKTQTITFTRHGIKDQVTGQIDWNSVEPQEFNDVKSPVINGYQADIAVVEGHQVLFGDQDVVVNVHYTKLPEQQLNKQSGTDVANTGKVMPKKAVTVANGTVQKTKQDEIKNSGQSTMQDTKQLPQTGNDKQAGLLSLIGGSLMASLAIFGLSKKKKHEN